MTLPFLAHSHHRDRDKMLEFVFFWCLIPVRRLSYLFADLYAEVGFELSRKTYAHIVNAFGSEYVCGGHMYMSMA